MQIAIVVFPGLTALDVVGPYEVLRYLPDADVRFVWHETGPVVTDSGMLALGATHTLDETPSPDIVLVPGSGTAIAVAAEDKRLREWLRSAHRTSTWTVSVCGGALVLAAAGLLEGRRAASHWQALTPLRAFGAVPCGDERVVFDGKLATCAGVSAGIDLALSLAARIAGGGTREGDPADDRVRPRPAVRQRSHQFRVAAYESAGQRTYHPRRRWRFPYDCGKSLGVVDGDRQSARSPIADTRSMIGRPVQLVPAVLAASSSARREVASAFSVRFSV